MELEIIGDRAVIQIEDNETPILTYNKHGRCIQVDISLDDFEGLCLKYTAIIKAVLADIKWTGAPKND